MKNRTLSRNTLLALACLALGFDESRAGQETGRRIGAALAPLLPRQILAGPQIGVTGSRFTASPEYRALIMPTPASDGSGLAPSWGAVLSARWSHWFSLTVAPRRETYRLATREETVSFPDNPFPHTLEASTDLEYNVWPISLGMGLFGRRQHLQVRLGVYGAYLNRGEIKWTVDGEPYSKVPPVQYRQSQSGWFVGTEYGFRMGAGELLVGVDTQRGRHSLLGGMDGSLKARSTRVHMAYTWTVMRR